MKKLTFIFLIILLITGCTARDNNTYDVYKQTYKVKDLINETLGKRYNPCEKFFEDYENPDTNYKTCMSNINMIENELIILDDLIKVNSDSDIRNEWKTEYETTSIVIEDLKNFYNGLYSIATYNNITALTDNDLEEIKKDSSRITNNLANKLNIKWYKDEESQSKKIDTIANNAIGFDTFAKKIKKACTDFRTCREKM